MITRFEQLPKKASGREVPQTWLLFPSRKATLRAALLARERGLADCTLVGPAGHIGALAEEAEVDLAALGLVDEPDPERAVWHTLSTTPDLLVNDGVPLKTLLPAILDPQGGLRTGTTMSGVSVIEIDGLKRLLLLADGLLVVSPDLEQRIAILQNAVGVAHKLGIEMPRVALLAANETVDPKSPVSVDAAQITVMARRNQIRGAVVDGPLGLDNAVSAHAAEVKGIQSDVAGQADILIAPDLESGNLLLHTLARLCRGKAINVVIGGRAPLILLAPDDDAPAMLAALALGAILA